MRSTSRIAPCCRRTAGQRSIAAVRRLLVCSVLVLAPTLASAGGKAGVGSGIPYGTPIFGAGLELDLGKYVGLLGGVGVGTYDSPWSYGARVSFAPPEKKWRPHVSGVKWTEGYGVYAGLDHDIGKPGGWVMTYGLGFGDVNLEANVGAMVGIGYRFRFK
jgi:hypothetical protein